MFGRVMKVFSFLVIDDHSVHNVRLAESDNMVELNVGWTFFQEQLLEAVDTFGV